MNLAQQRGASSAGVFLTVDEELVVGIGFGHGFASAAGLVRLGAAGGE